MIIKETVSLIVILVFGFIVSSCVSYSLENNLNGQIGKNIHEVIRPNYKNFYVKELLDEQHYIIRFNSNNNPTCSFEYVVRTRDDVVDSWHFVNDIPSGYCDQFVTGA